ncbi:hypothetical protein BJX76DRAFT_351771 [Aspergillus varians]
MGRVEKLSKATRFNILMLKKLQAAVASDPEIVPAAPVRPDEEDIRASLDASAPQLIGIMQANFFKCNADIVLKAVRDMKDFAEYTTLQYLQQHRPDIPNPGPLGLLRLNGIVLIFMSYQPGNTLTNVWPTLDKAQKTSIQEQLNKILTDLRSLRFTPGIPLGGIGGEGYKDIRRRLRRSDEPITTINQFEQFLFKGYRPGGHAFVELMRELCPPTSSCKIFSTHGDRRPDYITVEMAEDHGKYYEAVKSTSCLSPYEEDDWYLFLPDCVSPKRYAHWWLLNCVQETRVV